MLIYNKINYVISTYTKVKYTDGRNDVGRLLTEIKMRSSYMNAGSYSVNKEAIY